MPPSERKRQAWLLLVHNVPARPVYLRARIRRLLDQAGGIALKRSVYAFPARSRCRQALAAIATEATARGGHAWVCEARFLDSGTDALLVERARAARDADYESLIEGLRGFGESPEPAGLARARERFEQLQAVDFFEARGRRRAAALLAGLEKTAKRALSVGRRGDAAGGGRLWTTRRGIQIDRIASAWLVRRFVDPAARFRFIDPAEDRVPDEIRFDMPGGDYSHEDDRCTFETILRRFQPGDAALREVAEIVHDIDLKDGKFGRPEARGVERILNGMLANCPKDSDRLEKGLAFFDDLHRSFLRPGLGRSARRAPART